MVDSSVDTVIHQKSPGATPVSIWSLLKELIWTFDSPTSKYYVERCISLIDRLVAQTEPLVTATDLVGAIQSELPIPASSSQLPPTGLLGLCVNLATIVRHNEEDPAEYILRALSDKGIEFTCFPGAYDRESKRKEERDNDIDGISIHRFQLYFANPPSNQLHGLVVLQ